MRKIPRTAKLDKAIFGSPGFWYGVFFFQIEALLIISEKMHGHLQFSFWMPKALGKFCFLRIVLNHTKNIPVLVGTTYRQPKYLDMHKVYVQFLTKVGTIFNRGSKSLAHKPCSIRR